MQTSAGSTEGIREMNGKKYREVKEVQTAVNEFGQKVNKTIVKLVPLDGPNYAPQTGYPNSYTASGPTTYAPTNYRY